MRIHLADPAAASDLSESLRQRVGAVVELSGGRASDGGAQLEVSLLGSYGDDAMRSEIETAVRRWAFETHRRAPAVEP